MIVSSPLIPDFDRIHNFPSKMGGHEIKKRTPGMVGLEVLEGLENGRTFEMRADDCLEKNSS